MSPTTLWNRETVFIDRSARALSQSRRHIDWCGVNTVYPFLRCFRDCSFTDGTVSFSVARLRLWYFRYEIQIPPFTSVETVRACQLTLNTDDDSAVDRIHTSPPPPVVASGNRYRSAVDSTHTTSATVSHAQRGVMTAASHAASLAWATPPRRGSERVQAEQSASHAKRYKFASADLPHDWTGQCAECYAKWLIHSKQRWALQRRTRQYRRVRAEIDWTAETGGVAADPDLDPRLVGARTRLNSEDLVACSESIDTAVETTRNPHPIDSNNGGRNVMLPPPAWGWSAQPVNVVPSWPRGFIPPAVGHAMVQPYFVQPFPQSPYWGQPQPQPYHAMGSIPAQWPVGSYGGNPISSGQSIPMDGAAATMGSSRINTLPPAWSQPTPLIVRPPVEIAAAVLPKQRTVPMWKHELGVEPNMGQGEQYTAWLLYNKRKWKLQRNLRHPPTVRMGAAPASSDGRAASTETRVETAPQPALQRPRALPLVDWRGDLGTEPRFSNETLAEWLEYNKAKWKQQRAARSLHTVCCG
jgi:hypothetical protein